MSDGQKAYTGAAVFDGQGILPDHALLVDNDVVTGVVPLADIPETAEKKILDGGFLVPGFVDLQVNGGGGVMFNDRPDVETLKIMASAHAALGTTAFLPTLITDTPAHTEAAINAVHGAIRAKVDGIAGLHLEGPHLSIARKGAHDPALIRPMEERDLDILTKAAEALPVLMVTLAPESVTVQQVRTLANSGAIVSLGHSDADYETCMAYIDAGAKCVTHLFNAMSQMQGRAPGLVGAALQSGTVSTGLIADGIHVKPAMMDLALRAKMGPGHVFLVTDSMAPAGTDITGFDLNGRRIERRDGRLTLVDGTLAGADLEMAAAVGLLVDKLGVAGDRALAMATSLPAGLAGLAGRHGTLEAGREANFVHLDEEFGLRGVWTHGRRNSL